MNNKNYYYLSEIILGLREEYNNTRKQLDNLKSMMTIDNGYDVSFGFDYVNPERRYLIIELEKKVSGLNKLIDEVSKKFNRVKPYETNISCDAIYNSSTSKSVGNYVKETIPGKFRVDDQLSFYKECDKILHSKINLAADTHYTKIEDQNAKIKIAPNGVHFKTNEFARFAPCTGIDYHACTDEIVVNNYYNTPSFTVGMDELMRMPIPRSIIDSRLAKIIDENPKSLLNLSFNGLTNTKASQYFALEEQGNKVVASLSRTKM